MILACEPAQAGDALTRALALRRAGTHFSLALTVEDPREVRARDRARVYAAKYESWDEVRLMLESATPEIVAAQPAISDAAADALIELMRLSDGVCLRSWAEHARLLAMLGAVPRGVEIAIAANARVPAPPPAAGDRTDVVIYAPADSGDELAAFLVALADYEVPVTCIARDTPSIATRAQFVPAEAAGTALARARVIVDASRNDPGTSLALAAYGVPLLVSSGSGAAEVLRNAFTYDRWNRRSILAGVANALGGSAPEVRSGAFAAAPALRAQPAFAAGAPLVSIVVTTFNRHVLLAETLASIQRQTYPNVEIIVVNDAGADVAGIIKQFSRARLIDQASNQGPAAGRNRGLADARGEFVQLFDDDDEMFPDHVATLAGALLRSGLDVAYGQMLNAIVVPDSAGRYRTESLTGYVSLMDHADIQWAGSIATTSLMFRRAIIAQTGNVDETMEAAEDYEFWLRLAAGREWVRSPEITSLYFIRKDGTNRANTRIKRYAAAHRAIYAKHPAERALVGAGRASMLEYFSR